MKNSPLTRLETYTIVLTAVFVPPSFHNIGIDLLVSGFVGFVLAVIVIDLKTPSSWF